MENPNNIKNEVDDVEPSSHHSLSDNDINQHDIDAPSMNPDDNDSNQVNQSILNQNED